MSISDAQLIKACENGQRGLAGIVKKMLFRKHRLAGSVANGYWYVYRRHRWEEDKRDSIGKKVAASLKRRYYRIHESHAKVIERLADKDMLTNHARAVIQQLEEQMRMFLNAAHLMDNTPGANQMASMIKHKFCEPKFADRLDLQPMLLGVKNGVVDLKTGKFRNGTPDDMISKMAGVEWNGTDYPCPKFEAFLRDIIVIPESM